MSSESIRRVWRVADHRPPAHLGSLATMAPRTLDYSNGDYFYPACLWFYHAAVPLHIWRAGRLRYQYPVSRFGDADFLRHNKWQIVFVRQGRDGLQTRAGALSRWSVVGAFVWSHKSRSKTTPAAAADSGDSESWTSTQAQAAPDWVTPEMMESANEVLSEEAAPLISFVGRWRVWRYPGNHPRVCGRRNRTRQSRHRPTLFLQCLASLHPHVTLIVWPA